MDDFAELKAEERRIFFEGTAAPRNMQAVIIEKNFWVWWTLKELFRLPTMGEHLIFKGGTSLSKVLTVIERFSRHYCDCSELIRKGVGKAAAAKPELLARVAEHKNLFFRTNWARYGEATKGSLRVAPPEHRVKALLEDYGKTEQMFFGRAPEFDSIVARLAQWERELNHK